MYYTCTNNHIIFLSQTTKQAGSSKDMEAPKITESVNQESGVAADIKVVDTVDYVTPPGDNKEPEKKDVRIVHQTVEGEEGGPGVIQKGVAAVGRAAESAKEAISGSKSDKPK